MVLLLSTIGAAALWIVMIALNNKPLDSLLLCILIILIAATVQIRISKR